MTISCSNLLPSVLDIKTKTRKKTSFSLHYNTHVPSCPDIGLCFYISIKNSNCLLSGLFRSIQDNSFFSRRTRILFWDIWHLYWNTGYLSKQYFGIFEKITKRYRIYGVKYFGNGILGPPPKQTSMIKHLADKMQTSPYHLASPNRKSRTSGTTLG